MVTFTLTLRASDHTLGRIQRLAYTFANQSNKSINLFTT